MQNVRIRPQEPGTDAAAIARINAEVFDGGTPAFQALRERLQDDVLSLVAERDGELVGHVFFSPVSIDCAPPLAGMGLGELAVRADFQRQGIGAALTKAGLAELARRACPYVIVIGLPAYYPRLGFEPGATHGLRCQWQVPPASFMVHVLDPAAMAGVSGTARYRDV
jgi:putative acetyltransferase